MSRITVEIAEKLTEKEWQKYSQVWEDSNTRNPFISPQLLQLKNIPALQIAFIYNNAEIIGALPFIYANGLLRIAGEPMSDSIQFPFLPSTSITQKYQAIRQTLLKINPQNIEFKKLCTANVYIFLVIKAVKEINYQAVFVKSWKNLFVKEPNTEEGIKTFRSIFNKSNTRNYSNKFRREHNYTVSVIEQYNEEELDNFLSYFFMYHEIRWNTTTTPSIYSNKHYREELKEKVKVWLQEKACILFSLDVEGEPTSMAICLKTKTSIIYHQIAYSVNKIYLKYRINKLLIFELSKWMADNSITVLDFGVGDEPYKYEYTKNEQYLVRVYAAKSKTAKTHIKGQIDYRYQSNPRLINFLNNRYRVKVASTKRKVTTLANKLKYLASEAKSDTKFLSKKISIVTKVDVQYFYKYTLNRIFFEDRGDVRFAIGKPYQILTFYEQEIALTPAKRQYYLTVLAEKKRIPYCLYDKEGRIAAIAWVAQPKSYELPPKIEFKLPQVIIDCFTAKKHRGKGYYAYLLNKVCTGQESDMIIYTNDWNIASQRGIIKAGFEEIATRTKKVGKEYEWEYSN